METLIRKLESFGPLDEEDKTELRNVVARERSLAENTDIISEGEHPTDVHLITSGLACRCKLIESGKRQIVAYLLPGDICDLHVFILDTMDHTISTLSPCTIVNIPRAAIVKLLERPKLTQALLMATLVDEATLRDWITNVGQRNAEERIAHLFCELHARLQAVGLTENSGFDLPITQTELGDTVGLSTVHINRSLQHLREQGLVTFKSGRLRIPDVALLESMSGFRSNYLHLSRQGKSCVD